MIHRSADGSGSMYQSESLSSLPHELARFCGYEPDETHQRRDEQTGGHRPTPNCPVNDELNKDWPRLEESCGVRGGHTNIRVQA